VSDLDQIDFLSLRKTAMTVLEGDFPVVVSKVTYKKTQKDQPMWVITLSVTAGPYAGRSIGLNLVLATEHQFMVSRFFRFMEALGADENFFASKPSTDAVCAQIQGRHAIATLKEGKEFRGEKREEVDNLVSAGAGIGGVSVSVGGPVTVAATTLPKATSLPAAGAGEAPPEDPF
jgi:hypothetical protein